MNGLFDGILVLVSFAALAIAWQFLKALGRCITTGTSEKPPEKSSKSCTEDRGAYVYWSPEDEEGGVD